MLSLMTSLMTITHYLRCHNFDMKSIATKFLIFAFGALMLMGATAADEVREDVYSYEDCVREFANITCIALHFQ